MPMIIEFRVARDGFARTEVVRREVEVADGNLCP